MQVSALQKKLLNERSCTFPIKTDWCFCLLHILKSRYNCLMLMQLGRRITLSNISLLDEIFEMRLLIELDNSFIIDGG